MKATDDIIKMVDITKIYTGVDVGTTALKDIDLVVKKGEFLAITGRSGSGKSTLMHVIGTSGYTHLRNLFSKRHRRFQTRRRRTSFSTQ